ncbi:hypothetical protein BHYA_0002g01520 [Botrytis hyacinthi]|uniref:Uncharacterized protein n=1 Tax=Botrytis hyacinthi TaxID=278943 RepID=A0A4Z1HE82_9HELO|nr:hypothetical protein BHYA_0002g01520 [Botrytis hyacinthi]
MRAGSQYGSVATTMELYSDNYDVRNTSSVKPEAQLMAPFSGAVERLHISRKLEIDDLPSGSVSYQQIETHICRRSAESNNLELSALTADNTLAAFGEEKQERMV